MLKNMLMLMLMIFPWHSGAHAADALEYRLEAKETATDAQEFQWVGPESKKLKLESTFFMSGKDFKEVKALDPKNPNSPGKFEVEVIHSPTGKKKFVAMANKDRERSYCILFGNKIYQCYAFPPRQKGLYDKGSSIYGPFTKAEAEDLASKINHSLK